MAVADLNDAFNSVVQPAFTSTLATLGYVRDRGQEWQVAEFSGISADGQPFSVKSEPIRQGASVNDAARATAQTLLDRKPTP